MTVAEASTRVSPSAAARRRLLLVDGHGSSRAALGYLLRTAGFGVEQAGRGEEALQKAVATPFDLVVLDIAMPAMDGLRFLALLRRDPRTARVPAIVVTNDASREYVERCALLGARSFLIKEGLNVDALVTRIRQCTAEKLAAPPALRNAEPDPSAGWAQQIEALDGANRGPLGDVELPVLFPEVLPKVQGALLSDDLPTAARLAEQEPALAVELLAAAGRRAPVASLEQALRVLTPMELLDLVVALIARPAGVAEEVRQHVEAWWRHALAVAQLAGDLAGGAGVDVGVARTAGLLHDLGRFMLLAGPMGSRAVRVYDLARNMVIPTALAERQFLGVNHKSAAATWASSRGLARNLVSAIEHHDDDDPQRERLAPGDAQLSAVIAAANQIAKAAGFGSLFNDELMPLPGAMVGVVASGTVELSRGLAEVESLCLWRRADGSSAAEPLTLAGVSVAFVSPTAGAWNPYQLALARAGARVTAFVGVREALQGQEAPDVLIVDAMDAPLSALLPSLKSLANGRNLAAAPKLLLARRSHEPEARVEEADLPMHVYASPIRLKSLLQAVRRLVGGNP